MNEQLVVKNFGPFGERGADVKFKRVTVFIGPTGGGKSTLAKLKMVMSEHDLLADGVNTNPLFEKYDLSSYRQPDYSVKWLNNNDQYIELKDNVVIVDSKALTSIVEPVEEGLKKYFTSSEIIKKIEDILTNLPANAPITAEEATGQILSRLRTSFGKGYLKGLLSLPFIAHYIPAERLLISTLNASWPSLIDAKVDFPQTLTAFAKIFLQACKSVGDLRIPFLNIAFKDDNGQNMVIMTDGNSLQLHESASGIQSVTPILVSLEYLARNVDDTQSFIIEEPELNLYPTAQRDLVYWLLEKCTQGENDLTITTHSPYVLSALNLALYANKVATLFPYQRKKVEKLIPEKYWLKAEEFSAYFVANGGAKSIFDTKTGLLSESQLDEVSGEFADIFDRLTDLRVPEKKALTKAKPAKK